MASAAVLTSPYQSNNAFIHEILYFTVKISNCLGHMTYLSSSDFPLAVASGGKHFMERKSAKTNTLSITKIISHFPQPCHTEPNDF